jgi:hypothetical protein
MVMAHELYGHATDYIETGKSKEQTAIEKENEIRRDQGLPARQIPVEKAPQ